MLQKTPSRRAAALAAVTVAILLTAAAPGAQALVWLPGQSGTNAELRAVAFVEGSTDTAWAVGNGFEVHRTEDAGQTWEKVWPPDGLIGDAWNDMELVGEEELWAVGQNAIFQHFIGHTDDGGETWDFHNFYIPVDGVGNEGELHGVTVTDSGRLVATAVLWFGAGRVVVSDDGGETWDVVLESPLPFGAVDAAGDRVVVAGDNGQLHVSGDGGTTWTEADLPADAANDDLLEAQVLGPAGETAFVVGDDGTVLRTADGGATWTLLDTQSSTTLEAVAFDDAAQVGYVTGSGGTVLRTVDGGQTWTEEVVLSGPNFLAVDFVTDGDLRRAVAVGSGGAAWYTTELVALDDVGLPPL